MKKFSVEIIETATYKNTFIIEASSMEEAEKKVDELMTNLDISDSDNVETELSYETIEEVKD